MIRDVSFSELDALRQCPHKHSLAFRQKWEPKKLSPALAKGDTMHKVLETWFKGIMAGEALTTGAEIRNALAGKEGQPTEIEELVRWMFDGYVDGYGIDPDWQILAVEHEAQCWLPTPTGHRSFFRFNMKIDLVVRWKGRIWIVDHKTGKDLPTEKELALADQFGLYTWGMRQLGRKVHGVIYNAIRTQRNIKPMDFKERFSRTLLYRTDRELDRIAAEAYRDFKLGYSVSPEEAPRHPNPDTCKWRCPFTEPCLGSRKGVNEGAMLKDMGFVQDYSKDRGSQARSLEEVLR